MPRLFYFLNNSSNRPYTASVENRPSRMRQQCYNLLSNHHKGVPVAIQSGQLKQLITEKIIPPVSDTSKPETLKATLTFTESLGYEEASIELNLMWEESKARQALLDLCNSDPLYKPIIRYMVSGLQVPNVVAHLTPKASKLRLSEMVSQVGEAIAYFHYEPKSVTLARLCKRGDK